MKQIKAIPLDVGINRPYCVPYALSVVTGKSYKTIRALINKCRNRPRKTHVTGVDSWEYVWAMKQLGLDWAALSINKMTLGQWIDSRNKIEKYSTCLVVAGRHMVVVKGNQFIDNHTIEVVPTDKAPHRKKRVSRVYVLC